VEAGSPPLSGRRAEAARNDRRILEAARAVFIANPEAPIAAVAERAGVGISALYRRYSSKEELLRRLCADGLERYIEIAEGALADEADPWETFANFMCRAVDAETNSLTVRLAGMFTPNEELYARAAHARDLSASLFERARAAGAIRADAERNDIPMMLEALASIRLGGGGRPRELRHRYLALMLDGLRAGDAPPLPGGAPTWEELSGRWSR
jgi:AcrR family transcriptional regulator